MRDGFDWENQFQALCKARGIATIKMPAGSEFDFVCNGHRVQCKKTSYSEPCGTKTRIRLSRGSGCTSKNNYSAGAFDFFAILFHGKKFIVPVHVVGQKDGKMKRRIMVDRLSKWELRFDLLESNGSYLMEYQPLLF